MENNFVRFGVWHIQQRKKNRQEKTKINLNCKYKQYYEMWNGFSFVWHLFVCGMAMKTNEQVKQGEWRGAEKK